MDTGATACFIQEATVKALGIQQRVTQCGKLHVSLGNGSASPILGLINIEAHIDDHPYEMEAFVIGGKGPPLILRFPFFATNQLLIDCQEKRIWRRNGEEITCTQAQLKVLNPTDVTHLLEEMQRLQTELDDVKGQKKHPRSITESSPVVLSFELFETPLYLPFLRNCYLVLPFNRSWVLGPGNAESSSFPLSSSWEV